MRARGVRWRIFKMSSVGVMAGCCWMCAWAVRMERCGSSCARQSAAVEDEREAAVGVGLREAGDDMDARGAVDLDEAVSRDRRDALGGFVRGETLQGAL